MAVSTKASTWEVPRAGRDRIRRLMVCTVHTEFETGYTRVLGSYTCSGMVEVGRTLLLKAREICRVSQDGRGSVPKKQAIQE